jgi:hypothetical protein
MLIVCDIPKSVILGTPQDYSSRVSRQSMGTIFQSFLNRYVSLLPKRETDVFVSTNLNR